MQAGDENLEREPGPSKISAMKILSTLHLTLGILLILYVTSWNLKTDNTPNLNPTLGSSSHKKFNTQDHSINSLSNLLISRYKNRMKSISLFLKFLRIHPIFLFTFL